MSGMSEQLPKADRSACLDSPDVSRDRLRAIFAVAAVALLGLAAAGCREDRSNLLPRDSTERIEAEVGKIQTQVEDGLCFEALRAAQEIEDEINGLGQSVDENLLRTLRDGVTQLQITIQDECVQADAEPVTPEVTGDPDEVEPSPSQGEVTPPTDTNDGQPQRPTPKPTPTPDPTPTPTPPTPPDNSGGVSPSASGGSVGA